jgi:transcriptional regulator with XRE-family HTH domain
MGGDRGVGGDPEEMPYEWEFGERLREARKKAGMNQSALAKAALVSQNSISKWENGHKMPNVYSAYLLAKALNVSAGWLVAGEGRA